MSNKFNWDDEDDFRDIPEEVNGESAPAPLMPPSNPVSKQDLVDAYSQEDEDYDPEYEAVSDLHSEDEPEEDYSTVLSDARLRLEQGRLYEMIMNHDLFAGMDSEPKAMKNVQKQIRNFAKEQMEVMLGMRQTVAAAPGLSVDLPFNSLEVEALRALASAATKGATKAPDVERYVAPVESRRSTGLNPIGSRTPKPKREQKRTLPSRSPEPVRRAPKVDPNVEARLRDGSYGMAVEQQYIEEAKRQLGMGPPKALEKPIQNMSPEELTAHNKRNASRYRQARTTSALPQPSAAQVEGMMMQRVSSATAQAGPGFQALLDIVAKQAKK